MIVVDRWRELGFCRQTVTPAPAPPMPTQWDVPDELPGSGMLSRYPELGGAETLVRLVQAVPEVYDALAPARTIRRASGPNRLEGDWTLAFFAWCDSSLPMLLRWHSQTTTTFWQACGFARKPSYMSAWRRFAELEHYDDVFEDALGQLVRHLRTKDPRIGTAVFVDATLGESFARPVAVRRLNDGTYQRTRPG